MCGPHRIMLGQDRDMNGIFSRNRELERMHEFCTYQIKVRERIDEDTFNVTSPLRITLVQSDQVATLFAINTDQSGVVGLIRHLHQQGFVLLSLCRDR